MRKEWRDREKDIINDHSLNSSWAKQIPGFTELPLCDQMKMLQVSWAEVLTLQVAQRSLPYTGKIHFATDFWLDERSARECGALELFNHVSTQQSSPSSAHINPLLLCHPCSAFMWCNGWKSCRFARKNIIYLRRSLWRTATSAWTTTVSCVLFESQSWQR